jgi:glucokinase
MRAAGFDLGGSKLLACVIDENGTILGRTVRVTGRNTGPSAARRLITEAATELRDALGSFDAAGVGFPGQVDFSRGMACASVMLDGWREVPLAEEIGDALRVACVVDNDVNAAAVAELKQREQEAPDSMLFVAVGTGIGGAVVVNNRLWRGHTGVAGEIGNVTIDRHGPMCWCGRRGCLNTFASGAAIERALEPGMSLADQTWGDPRVDEVLEKAAEALGIGLANALNLLNPALVVLGGGVAQLGERWLDAVAGSARAEAFPEAGRCGFELARAGYQAGAVGAALLGLEALRATTTASLAVPAIPAAPGDPTPFGVPPLGR